MLQCLAIDDEPLALDLLEDNISKVPYLRLIAKCSDAFEATAVMRTNTIDLIFVDIQMPGLTGLQFIETLAQKPMVILITAYKNYALEGYSLSVIDYLVKPVELKRFMAACSKASELHQLKTAARQPGAAPTQPYIFVHAENSLVKLALTNILWVEAWKDYVKVYLKETARPVISRMTMKEIELGMPADHFLRIHKSYIVSLEKITVVKKSSIFIGDKELPIGDSYKDAVDQFVKKRPSF
jgi:two-component system LytT family response regulator